MFSYFFKKLTLLEMWANSKYWICSEINFAVRFSVSLNCLRFKSFRETFYFLEKSTSALRKIYKNVFLS